ncbi:hypothetical protein [Aequorivita capsosiphonis]|uniref:hypothetical protein n=1 Tax=Aequorivita capsosiphonis TaxID=487317 RepID=UPI00041D3A29|nr:hypothetical protein [Aequorivita capsosiphonis]
MEHLKILDEILRYLSKTEHTQFAYIRNDINEKSSFLKAIDNATLHSAILKLVKDGFVNQESEKTTDPLFNSPRTNNYYRISFEGLFFIKEGGYENQNQETKKKEIEYGKIQSEQKRQARNLVRLNYWLVVLTWVIAIGTFVAALYYLMEILKFFEILSS